MSAILRASGPEFDVDAFVAECDWHVTRVYRRGEPRRPTRPSGPVNTESGLNAVVSDAGFHDFAGQLRDAAAFLAENDTEVRRLVEFPGVEGVVIDFGIAWRDVAAQSDQFSADLVRRAGRCGIGLVLSHYPVSDAGGGGRDQVEG